MIQLVLAFFLFAASPVHAAHISPLSSFPQAPTRKIPQDQRPKPVGIVPRNRGYEALICILGDDRKTKPKWHPDSCRWFGKDGHKQKAHRNLRMTKRSSTKW